jgi:hypothetical protein
MAKEPAEYGPLLRLSFSGSDSDDSVRLFAPFVNEKWLKKGKFWLTLERKLWIDGRLNSGYSSPDFWYFSLRTFFIL